tara:strand:+ start:80 stop:745 length:666 start_codon:yes stop_codon:yes gene_type:complete
MTTTKEPNNIENTFQDDSVELKNVDLDALKKTAEKKPKKNVKQNKNDAKSDEESNKLQDQITSLQAELEDLSKQFQLAQESEKVAKEESLRNMAELENFKRRKNQEVDNFKKFASENVIKEFLPICDNFLLAASHANSSDQSSEEVIKGFMLIQQQLDSALAKLDVIPIETKDKPFDPNFHQAISQQSQEGLEPNMILQEVQKGYLLNGKVIRPSMVIVST